MLAPALWRHSRNRAFHNLQKRLLHTLARHVARYGRIVGLAGNLVDLIDIDNAALGAFDIIVGRLKQFQHDVLDILTDIAGLGQRCRIGHGKRHVQNTRQRLRQKRLAAACRADQKNVRLRQLHAIGRGGVRETLVMVVDGDGQDTLGVLLANHIIVKHVADFTRARHAFLGLEARCLALFADNIHAELDAFIADENRRPSNELLHFMLALSAERTVERIL